MAGAVKHDSWGMGRSYDHYMGRWSRLIAAEFLRWLGAPENSDWVDIGCGTGALTQTILDAGNPRSVIGIEPSEGFVAHVREHVADPRARFELAGAGALPLDDSSADVAVSGLVLNFVPDKPGALREMRRVTRPGGTISFYVWDYPGGGMGFIDAFWKAAAEIDPAARALDEADRFPFCTPAGLEHICTEAGVGNVTVRPIEVATTFADLEAFWHPFTLGAGPAPGYCMSLSEDKRSELKAQLARTLSSEEAISLPARAWAVRAAST
jgi:SAM-dependent methyltransferase